MLLLQKRMGALERLEPSDPRGGGSLTTATRFPRSTPSRACFRHRDNMNG